MAVKDWIEAAEAEYNRGQAYKKQRNLVQERLRTVSQELVDLKKKYRALEAENQELRREQSD